MATQRVTIMMGLPGSGKTTWHGKNLNGAKVVCSADHMWEHLAEQSGNAGGYDFHPSLIGEAHSRCYRLFLEALRMPVGVDHIIVDNTNVALHEISPYVMAAQAFGIVQGSGLQVVQCSTTTKLSKEHNVHEVPEEVIDRMNDSLDETMKAWPSHWPAIQLVPFTL